MACTKDDVVIQIRKGTDVSYIARLLGVPAAPQRRVPTRTPADFIDDAGALADQPLAHAVQCLRTALSSLRS
jgi:hypothetical protein